jgi:hypothetical protein
MSCCGQKRQQWQQEMKKETVMVSAEPILEKPVKLRYHGTNSLLIKGPVSGYTYLFAAKDPGLLIDSRDAEQFLEDSQKFSMASETDKKNVNAH